MQLRLKENSDLFVSKKQFRINSFSVSKIKTITTLLSVDFDRVRQELFFYLVYLFFPTSLLTQQAIFGATLLRWYSAERHDYHFQKSLFTPSFPFFEATIRKKNIKGLHCQ